MNTSTYRIPVLCLLAVAACVLGPGRASAQVGSCISGMYKVYDGRCERAELDSGSCTTRREQTPEAYWCCCDDGYVPSDGPTGGDPPEDPWGGDEAAAATRRPAVSVTVLYAFRDHVLRGDEAGMEYVRKFYRFSDELAAILKARPGLVLHTARVMEEHLGVAARLAQGHTVTIDAGTVDEVVAVVDAFHQSPGATPELRGELLKLRRDLTDDDFLARFGVRVTR